MSAVLAMEFFPETPPISWRKVFDDMKERGYAFSRAATTIGREWSTVQRWLAGAEPPYLDGEKILRLHALVCGEDLNQRRRRGE